MKSGSEEKPQTTDDLLTAYKDLQQFYDALLKDHGNEKAGKFLWRIVALVFVCLFLINTRTKTVWVPDPNSQDMRVEYSNWWGIEHRTFYPVWRKPSGEENWDSEQWCIKWPGDTWEPFLKDDVEGVYYEWPEKGYVPPQKR
jgi:hypothetical protein